MNKGTPCPTCGQRGWVAAGDGWCQHQGCHGHVWTGFGSIHPGTRCQRCALTLGDYRLRMEAQRPPAPDRADS